METHVGGRGGGGGRRKKCVSMYSCTQQVLIAQNTCSLNASQLIIHRKWSLLEILT